MTTTTKKTHNIKHDLNKLMKEHTTKSGVIRFLTTEGHSRADIARFMGIRYQHVRNVLINDELKTK